MSNLYILSISLILLLLTSGCRGIKATDFQQIDYGVACSIVCALISVICVIICLITLNRTKHIKKSIQKNPSKDNKEKTSSGDDKRISELESKIIFLDKSLKEYKKVLYNHSHPSNENVNRPSNNTSPSNNNAKEQGSSNQVQLPQRFFLKAIDGEKLAPAQSEDSAHYCAWKEKDTICFKFIATNVQKAINNRSSIIEPFCEISSDSKNPDGASDIKVLKDGKLDKDNSVIDKVLIKYV